MKNFIAIVRPKMDSTESVKNAAYRWIENDGNLIPLGLQNESYKTNDIMRKIERKSHLEKKSGLTLKRERKVIVLRLLNGKKRMLVRLKLIQQLKELLNAVNLFPKLIAKFVMVLIELKPTILTIEKDLQSYGSVSFATKN